MKRRLSVRPVMATLCVALSVLTASIGVDCPPDDPTGPLVAPGKYEVEMALVSAAGVQKIGTPQSFAVKPVPGVTLEGRDYTSIAAFQAQTSELLREMFGAAEEIKRTDERLRHIRPALVAAPRATPELFARLAKTEARLADLSRRRSITVIGARRSS